MSIAKCLSLKKLKLYLDVYELARFQSLISGGKNNRNMCLFYSELKQAKPERGFCIFF